MVDLTITLGAAPELPLGEYGSISRHLRKIPILCPELEGQEFEIYPELIYMMKEIAFAGKEEEDPSDHLTRVHDLCVTLKTTSLPIEFVLLKPFSLVFER